MEIRITTDQLIVWLTLIFGLAYTGFSTAWMYNNGSKPDAGAVVVQVLFGLFLTAALTGVLWLLVGLASKMSSSSSEKDSSQPEMKTLSSKGDGPQTE